MNESRTPDTSAPAPMLPNMSARVNLAKGAKQEKGSTLAYASVDLGGCFAITGIKIIEGKDGPFVAMPNQMGRDRKFHDICFPTTAEMREAMSNTVLDAYVGALEHQADLAAQAVERLSARGAKSSLRDALQSAQREVAARPAPAPARTADIGDR